MAEFNANLWAPWRMQYVEGLSSGDGGGCFLCRYANHPDDDAANDVLWRSEHAMVLLNKYPYTAGHLLVAPTAHVASLDAIPEPALIELTLRQRDAIRVLSTMLTPQGFNLGANLGRCAGAGLPDHIHWHIVPRWGGDTNFMSVLSDVRLMPTSLGEVRQRFLAAAKQLGIG